MTIYWRFRRFKLWLYRLSLCRHRDLVATNVADLGDHAADLAPDHIEIRVWFDPRLVHIEGAINFDLNGVLALRRAAIVLGYERARERRIARNPESGTGKRSLHPVDNLTVGRSPEPVTQNDVRARGMPRTCGLKRLMWH